MRSEIRTKVVRNSFLESGYVYDYALVYADEKTIYFKGTAYSRIAKRKIQGVWAYDIATNTIEKFDIYTDKHNVFRYGNRLLSYDEQGFYIHNLD